MHDSAIAVSQEEGRWKAEGFEVMDRNVEAKMIKQIQGHRYLFH